MIFSSKKTIRDVIIELLIEKPLSAIELQKSLEQVLKESVTLEGVYKNLRELIKGDVVTKQRKSFIISNVWRNKVNSAISNRRTFRLFPGEQVVYRFSKIDHMDMFWKHTINDIHDELGDFPVFHSNPHNFWYLVPGRGSSEKEYREIFSEKEKHVFTLIGGVTVFDKNSNKERSGFEHFSFTKKYPFTRREHYSIIGPYIITTKTSSTISRVLDFAYGTSQSEKELFDILKPRFLKPGPINMTVEYDELKAKKLRKRISTEFHIPRELREKFDLF